MERKWTPVPEWEVSERTRELAEAELHQRVLNELNFAGWYCRRRAHRIDIEILGASDGSTGFREDIWHPSPFEEILGSRLLAGPVALGYEEVIGKPGY